MARGRFLSPGGLPTEARCRIPRSPRVRAEATRRQAATPGSTTTSGNGDPTNLAVCGCPSTSTDTSPSGSGGCCSRRRPRMGRPLVFWVTFRCAMTKSHADGRRLVAAPGDDPGTATAADRRFPPPAAQPPNSAPPRRRAWPSASRTRAREAQRSGMVVISSVADAERRSSDYPGMLKAARSSCMRVRLPGPRIAATNDRGLTAIGQR